MSLKKSQYYRKIERKGYLEKFTLRGHQKRFGYPVTLAQQKRIDYEISVIAKKQLCDHFVVLSKNLQYLRKLGIMERINGPISASFVAYCLGISDIDPLEHDIIFESYLNPLSEKIPVCEIEISNDSLLHTSINEEGRYQTHLVFPGLISPDFKADKTDGKTGDDLNVATDALKNGFNHLAINKSPLVRFEYNSLKFEYISEHRRLINLCSDFYLIQETLKNIKRFRGKELELSQIPCDDPKTYEVFAERDFDDITWLGFDELKIDIGHFNIRNFCDLIIFTGAVASCIMPDIISGDYLMEDVYEIVYRKDNPGTIPEKYPEIAKILQESYGYILFYEHIVKIAARTTGMTNPEACLLVDILASGDMRKIAKVREDFIQKARKNGYTADESAAIFNIISTQANRFWHKATVADWALFIYRILYLKANYPNEYNTALITGTKGESVNRDMGE